jgi:lipoprotein-releasing system ATP-binding protein
MVAVTGASGAGKSTLLHIIGGIESADGGSVKLDDIEITSASTSQLKQYHSSEVGFIFQFHHLLADLSAAENVALPLYMCRESRRKAMQQARAALDQMNLRTHANHPVTQLSGGEQQRVAVARALITQPRLVLADEPTGNLDATTGEEIAKLLTTYCKSRPAAILIATHNQQIANACDRIVHLHEGVLAERN